MPRMTAAKRSELESFWRAHLDGWRRSDLNQLEYRELHGLPLKRLGNRRAKFKHEEPASAGKLLYRRGDGPRHMSRHMSKEIPSATSSQIPSARSAPPGARRRFSAADKRRIVEEAEPWRSPLRSENASFNAGPGVASSMLNFNSIRGHRPDLDQAARRS